MHPLRMSQEFNVNGYIIGGVGDNDIVNDVTCKGVYQRRSDTVT